MASLNDPAPSVYGQRAPLGRRATGFALAILANLLLILMLLSLAPFAPSGPPAGRAPVLIDLPPAAQPTRARTAARSKAATAPSRPPPTPEPPPPPPPPVPWNIMIVSKEVFAASDISKLPQRAPELASNAAAAASASSGGQADDDGVTETGPNGERLYNARWYVEPTNAELSYYLPASAPRTGVAMIACRTVARFRVDDCVELGESPAGSGLSRAIRQAAWQFKVRPPSVGGRPQVGAWVRIRIDFSQARAP